MWGSIQDPHTGKGAARKGKRKWSLDYGVLDMPQ